MGSGPASSRRAAEPRGGRNPRSYGPMSRRIVGGAALIGHSPAQTSSVVERVRRTVALLSRRGFALDAENLGAVCLGGGVSERDVRWAVAASPDLAGGRGPGLRRADPIRAGAIRQRADAHDSDAPQYLQMTLR